MKRSVDTSSVDCGRKLLDLTIIRPLVEVAAGRPRQVRAPQQVLCGEILFRGTARKGPRSSVTRPLPELTQRLQNIRIPGDRKDNEL